MIYILFITLCITTTIAYFQGNRCFTSPWFIVNVMFLVCVGTYALFINLMGKDISILTVFVILWGLISWGVGQSLARRSCKRRGEFINGENLYIYEIPQNIIIACTVTVFITVIYSYRYFMEIGESMGGNNFLAAYGAARVYMLAIQEGDMSVEIDKPSLLILFEMISSSIAYYFIYVVLYNKIICKKFKVLYLLPIMIYIPILFFTTSRMAFLSIICLSVGIGMTLVYAKLPIRMANKRIVRKLLPVIAIGALLFWLGGAIRTGAISEEGYSGEGASASTSLCMYVASNIYALDYYLEGNREHDFGAKTLGGIRQILGRLGVEFKTRPRHYENVKYKTGAANVYTGFKEDIVDYTLAGYWFYLILIGFVCGCFFYRAQSIAYMPHGVFFVILGKLYYPIFIYFYTDDFYSLTGVDFLIPIFFVIIIDRYIKNRYIQKLQLI